MNTEFSGILGGKLNLESQLSRIKKPAASRKLSQMIESNTSIARGAGSPIKTKTDYQEVMKVRESNFELRSLNNSINSIAESLNEVTGVQNSFTEARSNLLSVKQIVEEALSEKYDNLDKQQAKQEELNNLLNSLDGIARNAKIGNKKIFDGNFNVNIPIGDNEEVQLDLTFNPDVIYDLEAVGEIRHIWDGFHDGFGNAIESNEDYVVIAADNASTIRANDEDQFGNELTGEDYVNANEYFKDGAIQIIQKSTGKQARFSVSYIASTLGYRESEIEEKFTNIQFGSSISLNGDKLVIGASREDGQSANPNNYWKDMSTQGAAFLLDLDDVNFSSSEEEDSKNIINETANSTLDFVDLAVGSIPSGVKELQNWETNQDFFGKDVLIDGNKAYVSTFEDGNSSISIFEVDEMSYGNLIGEIQGPAESVSFGYQMEVTEDKLIVSGYMDDDINSSQTEVGALYIFDKNNLSAAPTVITSPLTSQGNQFGNAIATDGNIIAVGEHKAGKGANITTKGSVHLFDTEGEFIRSLTPSSTELVSGDEFGSQIAMSDRFIAVTASGDDDKGNDRGAVYVFDKNSGIELAKITKANVGKGFGTSLSFDGDKLLIGAVNNSYEGTVNSESQDTEITGAGSVFEYDLSGLEVPSESELLPDPNNPEVQPTINISTDDLSSASIADISSGNTEAAVAILANINGLLKGLDIFEGNVTAASSKLNTKLEAINNQKEQVMAQNTQINKEFEEKESAASKTKFKENPNIKKENDPIDNSLKSVKDAFNFIDSKMNDSDATKLKTYLNTFVMGNPKQAFKALSNAIPKSVSNLITGAM